VLNKNIRIITYILTILQALIVKKVQSSLEHRSYRPTAPGVKIPGSQRRHDGHEPRGTPKASRFSPVGASRRRKRRRRDPPIFTDGGGGFGFDAASAAPPCYKYRRYQGRR